jgi:hypothetical protein
VRESITGPYIFVIGEGFLVQTSMVSGSGDAWPLRSSPAMFSNCRRRNEVSSCSEPRPHPDLAMSKVTSLIRWRHAPPQEFSYGLPSAPAACRLDRMTGGVNACGSGSLKLRETIRCSDQMLRQIQAGVKLSERQ